MSDWVEVRTQEELDDALRDPKAIPVMVGDGTFNVSADRVVRAADSVSVEASGAATVEAWGSATVRAGGKSLVGAWQGASVEVTGDTTCDAWDDATVVARDSAYVRVWGHARVVAHDRARVEAEHWTQIDARDHARVEAWGAALVFSQGHAVVSAWETATVKASGSCVVRAWGSATVEVVGSCTLEAWDATTVRAGGTAQVRARGAAMIRARGQARIDAGDEVAVTRHGPRVEVTGGSLVEVPRFESVGDWCAFHGVRVADGVATLYKAVGEDYASRRGTSYAPGSKPQADDWDGGERECGGGLHFAPSPAVALQFFPRAVRYVACPVRLEDMAIAGRFHQPGKIKARGVCAPVYEVDGLGRPLGGENR